MKISYEVKSNASWCQVGKIDVEECCDELIQSGEYETEWLADCHSIYVPKDDEIPFIAYHFYSGTIRIVGCKVDIETECFDVMAYLLTNGDLNGLYVNN